MEGTVKFFDSFKGFGFVKGSDGKEYFVHQSALEAGLSLEENDAVEFDPEQGDRGPKAVNVRKAGAGSPASEPEESAEEPEESEDSDDDSSDDEDSEEDEDEKE